MNVPLPREIKIEDVDRLDQASSQVVHLDVLMSAIWGSLFRHKRLVLSASIVGLLLSTVYLLVTPAQYSSSVLIMLDPRSNSSIKEVAVSDANVDSAKIESEVEILKSERILRQVVGDEKLVGSPSLAPGPIKVLVNRITGLLRFGSDDRLSSLEAEVTSASVALGKLTSVKRIGLTYVVEVTATMLNPKQAASVANAYAIAYIDNQLAAHEEVARQMGNLLRQRTDDLQEQAQKAEQAVEQLKFSGSLEGANSAAARVSLTNLESRAQTFRTLHDKLLEQFTMTSQQQFSDLSDARIASAAYPPLGKSAPKTLLILVSGVFIGYFSGTLSAMLIDKRQSII